MNENLYQRYKKSSPIFNPGRTGLDLGSLSTCKAELLELEGDENGQIAQGRDLVLAKIPQLEQSLKDIQASFEQMQKQAKHEGRTLEEMPGYMQEDYEKAEARLMVRRLESMKLRERINALEAAQVEKPSDDKVLRYGPIGTGRMQPTEDFPDGRLVEIDGQRLDFIDGGLVITDDRSPFNGMKLIHYKEHVLKPFRKEQKRRRKIALECAQKDKPIPKECKKMPEFRFWPEAVARPGSEVKKGFKRKEKVS
jgi:hypothetical protein